jgi:hypothetical protein
MTAFTTYLNYENHNLRSREISKMSTCLSESKFSEQSCHQGPFGLRSSRSHEQSDLRLGSRVGLLETSFHIGMALLSKMSRILK